MKKFFFLTFLVLFGIQFSFAMVGNNNNKLKPVPILISTNTCNFTKKELINLKVLSFVLGTKGDILDRKASEFKNSDEYKQAIQKRKDFINQLKKTIECNGGFKNYDEFKKGILTYVLKINDLKKTQKKRFLSKFPEADKIMIDGQQKLFFMGKDGLDIIKGVFNEKTKHNIKLEFGDENSKQMFFPNFKLNLGILSDGFFDLYNKKIDLNLGLSGNSTIWMDKYNYETNNKIIQEYKLGGDIKSSIKLSKYALYFMLNKFDINFLPLEDNQVQEFIVFKEKLQRLLDKRIKIPLDISKKREFVGIVKNFDRLGAIKTLYLQSLLQFLYKDGDTYYAVPSINICKMFDGYQKQSCFDNIKESIEKTSKKGFITLKVNGDNYELGLSSKFVIEDKEGFDESLGFLTKKPILTWNNSGIQTITIPFDEQGQNGFFVFNKIVNIIYKNNNDYGPIDLKFNGVYNDNGIELDGKVINDGFDANIKFSFLKDVDKYSIDFNIYVQDKEGKKMGSLEYNISRIVKSLSNYSFVYPNDNEVLNVDEVENLMK